jgi:hypothetical protein
MADPNVDVAPHVLANAIMGRLYDVLTNGDETVPKSADNFFSWCTPGIPVGVEDFRFLSQGLTGVVTPAAVSNLTTPAPAAGSSSSATGSAAATKPAPSGTTPAPSGTSGSSAPQLTPELMNQLRAQDTNAVYQQAEMLARIVDFVPDVAQINNKQFAQFSVANDEGTLSDRYKLTLQMSQVMHQELDDATKANIARFRGLLQTTTTKTDIVTGDKKEITGPSPLVQAYHDKMAAYDAAALNYNSYRIAALAANDPAAVQYWAINANILRDQVKAAMDDWITNGYKEDYEEIAAYIQQVQARDMMMLKQEYEDDLQKATLTGISSGSDFYYTALAPGDFAQSLGWSRFTFNIGDYHTYSGASSSASGFSQQATGGFMGLFGGTEATSTSQSQQEYTGTFKMDSFKLAFEVCQVPILRPWFKDAFFMSKTWRFDQTNPDFKSQILSDGGSPPKGYIPAYPTNVVFIRNLSMSIDHTSSAAHFIQQQQSSSEGGGGVVNLGFLTLGGSASHYSSSGYSKRNVDCTWNDQGLTVPGMQIAGFKCHVLSTKCPSPDPSIKNWA